MGTGYRCPPAGTSRGWWQRVEHASTTTKRIPNCSRHVYSYELKATQNQSQPLCLDVKNKSTAENALLVLWPCDGSASQQWLETLASGRTR
jgi:hypothetical protein